MKPCPLIFEPIFKPKIWGGHNLARLFDKKPPGDVLIGESWECADLPSGESVVARGPVKGRTLHSLVEEWGDDLLGRAEAVEGRFPLVIKFLDAGQPLSIQVHPGDGSADAAAIKHEAWHVLHAEKDAQIYRGLRPGTDVAALQAQVKARPAAILDFLQSIPVKKGDTLYLPGGTIHALGGGIVVAEVQTPSDTTYRLYDWDRTRPASDAGMHIDEAWSCVRTGIDFAKFERRDHVTSMFTTVTRLVTCPRFVIERVRFIEGIEQDIPYAEMVCWIMLEGRGELSYAGGPMLPFAKGDTLVLPAGMEKGRLKTLSDCAWLEVTIPAASDLAEHERPSVESLRQNTSAVRPITLNIDGKPGERFYK